MRKLIGNIGLNPSSWISAETWCKRKITRHNIGEQPFAMNFLKTSGHTHFEEKSKSVFDQHQTTEASASAVWFCSSIHQYQESKQLLAGTLGNISSRAMRIYFSIIVLLFISGTTFNSKSNPEEIALNFLIDSLINKPIYSFNHTEKQAIYINPLISKSLYENGFLNGFKLYSEGLVYGFPEEIIPIPMTKKEYKKFGYPKSEIEKFERIIKASNQKRFNPIYNDTITIELPKSIQLIDLKNDQELIQQDSSIYIRVFKALETEKEFLVQLTLYENFIDQMDHKAGFIMEFIINKNDGGIEWDIAGSYH